MKLIDFIKGVNFKYEFLIVPARQCDMFTQKLILTGAPW